MPGYKCMQLNYWNWWWWFRTENVHLLELRWESNGNVAMYVHGV